MFCPHLPLLESGVSLLLLLVGQRQVPSAPSCQFVCVCVCTDKEKMKGFYLRVWAIFEQFKSELIQERSTNIMQLFKTSPWSCWDIKPNIFALDTSQSCGSSSAALQIKASQGEEHGGPASSLGFGYHLCTDVSWRFFHLKNLPVMHGWQFPLRRPCARIFFFFTVFFPYHTHPEHLATSSLSSCPRPTTFCNPKGLSLFGLHSVPEMDNLLCTTVSCWHLLWSKSCVCSSLSNVFRSLCTGQASSNGF